ncbi:hypothetical protein EDD37DRAFT_615869 [Exophiala viscosa]|uniref:uncharacterized protein n=1 Tax=Exophiala viscosa TaxID=2486360 RepID=UPI00219417A2|nr:hypothetical protein EDD37DRAFT_615869 [Exophiala viscosa]
MDRYRGQRRSPPPRDRPPRNDRDDHPNVEYFGAGESYRPGGQTGDGPYRPANRERQGPDTWSGDRREGRDGRDGRDGRRDERREDVDSYVPVTNARPARPRSRSPAFRRRSRSRTPPNRGREDLFANRRSPPRRYSPRRSPPRRRSRSAFGARPRSPPDAKRFRDFSPDRRSPKRERRTSPDRDRFDRRSPPRRGFSPGGRGGESYRPRSRTPPRGRPGEDNWRRRSPSPRTSVPASGNTSRRSSPPVHPDRASLAGSVPRSPARPARAQYDRADSASRRDRSPFAGDGQARPRDVSAPRDDVRPNGDSLQPPSGPSGHRNGDYSRPPPTGPARSFNQSTSHAPPTGPAASTMSMSAHSRGGGPATFSAPTGPRGSGGRSDGPPRDFVSPAPRGRGSLTYRGPAPHGPRGGGYGRGDFGAPRSDYGGGRGEYGGGAGGGRGDFSSSRGDYGGSGSRGDFSSSRGDYGGSGGRGDFGGGGGYRGGFGRGEASFSFRGNSSSSGTYPRTQRFNTLQQHLATNEKIVPGGKLLPSGLPPDQEKRIKMLEAESERMRTEIADKQKNKREILNEWDVRERESERESLRSELAEAHLQQLMEGEDGIGRAAF